MYVSFVASRSQEDVNVNVPSVSKGCLILEYVHAYSHVHVHTHRTIVALVYNVLKTMMSMNTKLFDDLTNSYKADRQK